MKVVTKYVSDDGREFLREGECVNYEALCAEVDSIMSTLVAIPALPGCEFANGAGYIQHDPATALAARNALLSIANRVFPHNWFTQSIADGGTHASWAGRLIGEMNEICISRAWHRFSSMTADYREFGQPYFANNQHEAKSVCLAGAAA